MAYLLHNLLEKSSQLYPEVTAVSYGNKKISYRELNFLSEKLSFSLFTNGVKRGNRLGICIDKSIDAVLAIFGALKTGSCYVPLDPLAPTERQSCIINDCSLEYLITSSQRIPQLKQILKNNNSLKCIFILDLAKEECKEEFPGTKVIFKDEILESREISLSDVINQADETDLAYILYTSGSTGRPKGVMISHKASLAFVDWAFKCFNVNISDNVSSHAPFHFDLSIFDIFVTIKAGATMHIVPKGLSAFPKSLAEFIENKKINIWYSVPSVLIQLVLYGDLKKNSLSSLRHIIFAGEVFPVKYLRKFRETISRAKYCNLYGPTETNVCAYYFVESVSESEVSIPIGKPCEGTSIFLVDETGNLAARGELGELFVSGQTLMEGYWNDPQKTKNALLGDFSYSRGEKVYKTGDWMRIDKDGNLEYHGRRDNMIKSRGYRIELAEIESALLAHPDINEIAVVGVPDEKIGNKIKAVIVLKKESYVSESDIKRICLQRLPIYMVPEIIIFKKTLPRTSTGKIDRKHLEMEKS